MLTTRRIEREDEDIVAASLSDDPHHQGTPPEFFYAPGSVCNVYEDENGPVLFLRGAKALRLDIQFVDNKDAARNRQTLQDGFPKFLEAAQGAGFTELIFNTNSPLLRRFCERQFGFKQSAGELRLHI